MSGNPNVLEEIRARPPMYLGTCSLTALFHFIDGYGTALLVHRIEDDDSLRLPSDFHDWVAYRLHCKSSTAGWLNLILEHCQDEERALARFFELLDEHRSRRSRLIATYSRIHERYKRRGREHEITETTPDVLELVTYTQDPGFFVVTPAKPHSLWHQRFFPEFDWFKTLSGLALSDLEIVDAEVFRKWEMLDREEQAAKAVRLAREAKEWEATKSEQPSNGLPCPPPPPPLQ